MGGFSRFFIYRPIFAMAISIVILLVGLLSIPILPVESVPNITPPTVKVSASFPGASAEVLAETVAQPIEQEVNGVEDMLYMSSKSPATGKMSLTVTFEVGTNPDMSQVLTQNRVSIADPKLPEDVKRQGVKVEKQSTSMVLAVVLNAPDGRYDMKAFATDEARATVLGFAVFHGTHTAEGGPVPVADPGLRGMAGPMMREVPPTGGRPRRW